MNNLLGKVGLCPQTDILIEELSAIDHLKLACALRNEQNRLAHEYLLDVRLDESVWYKRVRYLSGGMRRKVSVALALVGNPEIIVLDEPTNSMDPESC